jgi:hypothetical protein
MEAVRTSETSVYSETTRHYIPEGSNLLHPSVYNRIVPGGDLPSSVGVFHLRNYTTDFNAYVTPDNFHVGGINWWELRVIYSLV